MGKRLTSLIFIVLIVVSVAGCAEPGTDEQETEYVGNFLVQSVYDGDTLTLSDGERVRLIGINAPEIGEFYSLDSKELLTSLVGGKEVTLEMDTQSRDSYERLLRYVFIDDLNVNVEIVKQGLATSFPYGEDVKYLSEFEAAQDEAAAAQIGMWTPSEHNVTVVQAHYDADGPDNDNLNDEYIVFVNDGNSSLDLKGWVVKEEGTKSYTFDTFSLGVNASVVLHTGSGTDNSTDVYWGRSSSLWNNDGDSVWLRDSFGGLVAYHSWS